MVAADETGVTGFVSFGDFRAWPGYRYSVEHSIFVAEGAHRRGTGRALMTAVMERAAGLGKHVMVGGIDSENTAAIKFHEKLGFEHAGTLPAVAWKFDTWRDLVFMTRKVAAQ